MERILDIACMDGYLPLLLFLRPNGIKLEGLQATEHHAALGCQKYAAAGYIKVQTPKYLLIIVVGRGT